MARMKLAEGDKSIELNMNPHYEKDIVSGYDLSIRIHASEFEYAESDVTIPIDRFKNFIKDVNKMLGEG